ncbi:3-dehydroquinate dehydratase type I [Parasponia andersonii]|uniref:3-dehydroquinate dehydratase type I n=1 Tax=Parasponia andersonii TaxID=3476 RepID=A0A2P5B1B1_PARAD|nr:3-dehydroquinate dehydratase type I [Parasponia andersonii]
MATLPWASHCPINSLRGTCGCLLIGFILLQILIARNEIDPISLLAFNLKKNLRVCAPIENESMYQMLASMTEAKAEGADPVELRIDFMSFSNISQVEKLIKQRTLPAILSPIGISSTILGCSPMSLNTKETREDDVDEAMLAATYKKIR